ncbi:diguanylate cyclase [Secundilactobacillus paracollinoides]|uniref:diguanylate cyclase n=1 Tax=Secundilactobacillus paracollinoides TaxID=240427 RepID=UPI0006D0CBD8|nr:diguanylate cyclase [Secundilactobacillus paracollinoides]KRL78397.1 Signal transduction diguanylate cyclase [Secundilactobacillus paracollinoides DSM 15502 = JCM 11969]
MMITGLTADSFFTQLTLLIFAIFFVSGIMIGYSRTWHLLETNNGLTEQQQNAIRLGLPLVVWLLGGVLCLAGLFSSANTHMYTSIGVFLIAFPILDTQLKTPGYLARCAVLFIVWEVGHIQNLFSVQNILVSLGLLGLFYLIRTHKMAVRYRFWTCMAAGLYVALGFWLTYPGIPITDINLWFSIGLYMVMTAITCGYWIIQKSQDMVSPKNKGDQDITPTTLYASYERDVNSLFDANRGSKTSMTIAIIDIDRFTDINDRFGRRGANAILADFEALLQQVLQQYSTAYHLFRSGGEEFNAIFTNATPVDTAPILLDCWDTVRTHEFYYQEHEADLTISVGVTAVQTVDESVEDTYKRATKSLNQSKRVGRDAITVEGVDQHARRATNWYPTYRYFVQPIVNASQSDHPLLLNEMLLREFDRNRWRLPESFEIPVTTQISLIKQVLNHNDCRGVNINLTAKQFSDPEIAKALVHFKKHEPRIDEFVVEIMDAPTSEIVENISHIYAAGGIKLYLDDVGSDNSYELVLDMFKYIDGIKFAIQNLRKTNAPDQLLERIGFWKNIANQNNLEFVLEGVETNDESQYSVDHYGIFRQQGYYFAKPSLPEEESVK